MQTFRSKATKWKGCRDVTPSIGVPNGTQNEPNREEILVKDGVSLGLFNNISAIIDLDV